MKTETLVAQNWDDVVFENRNRDYGAYSIRKEYSKNMMTGMGVSVSFACLLIALPAIMNFFGGNHSQSTIPFITPKDSAIVLYPPPVITPPVLPPPPAQDAPRPVVSPAHIQLVDTPTETDVTPNVDIQTPPTTNNTGEGDYVAPVTPVEPPPLVVDPPAPTVFDRAEVMPTCTEMNKYLSRNLKYPTAPRRLGIEGKVFVGFIVNAEGKVVDVKIIRGIHPDCDKEAARVISAMPQWTPGRQNNHSVSVRMVIPINFQMMN